MSMKNAKELMLEYTASSIRDPKKTTEMFAEDGAFEMPQRTHDYDEIARYKESFPGIERFWLA